MPFDASKNKQVVAAANADTTITVGTPAAALVDVGATFDQAKLNNNFATVGTELNEVKAALRAAGILST